MPRTEFRFLESLLFKGLIANIENIFYPLLATKQPYCLVAIENGKFIGAIIVKPNNIRGSCWYISLPIIFSSPKFNTLRAIKLSLIKEALKLNIKNSKSWFMKYPLDCIEELSIARELGFQQQKTIKLWSAKIYDSNQINFIQNDQETIPPFFETVNKDNSYSLWKLEKLDESVSLREIFDRQPLDYLKEKNNMTKVFFSNESKNKVAIAGLIQQNIPHEITSIKLVRDLAWDERIMNTLIEIHKDLSNSKNQVTLETNKNDTKLNEFLVRLGFDNYNEKILLGKTYMKRKDVKSQIKVNKTMSEIFEKLQPGNTPVPSPYK